MTVEVLLAKLDKVKRLGPSRWQSLCPAHDDKGPSLAIRETDEGVLLLHCFAGCSVPDVLHAVGMDMAALFPPRQDGKHSAKPERRPFPAADILRCIAFEALVVAIAGTALVSGRPFSPVDRERLILAVGRIQAALTAGGLENG